MCSIIKKLVFLLFVITLIMGCSDSGISNSEMGSNADQTNKKNSQNNNTNQITPSPLPSDLTTDAPTYINENKYEGNEREVVGVLNRYIKIFYENDVNGYKELYVDPQTMKSVVSLGKVIQEITEVNFNEEISYEIEDNELAVIVQSLERNPRSSSEPQVYKQLIIFRDTEAGWKFVGISDWW